MNPFRKTENFYKKKLYKANKKNIEEKKGQTLLN